MLPVSALSRPSHHLLLLSSIFLLCSFPALPSLLLHSHSPSSTSSPHVPNTWVCKISPEPVASWWERVLGRNFRTSERVKGIGVKSTQPYNPMIAFCHLETFLAVPWPTLCFAKWFWRIARDVLIQRKKASSRLSSSLNRKKKERMPKRKSPIIYKGERMFEKKKEKRKRFWAVI